MNVFEKLSSGSYQEPAIDVNFAEFEKVVRSRRSVRVYDSIPVPDEVVEKALDLALLAPNSSNLQTWEFYWVKNPNVKKRLDEACFNQNAARTAPVLIVCVARPKHWKKHARQMLDLYMQQQNPPKAVIHYYKTLVPMIYRLGPLNLFGWARKLAFSVAGLFRPVPRGPSTYAELREWSVKSAALACENLMLSFRALGYDSCPMEGFDEVRVRKTLDLPRDAHVVMIVSAGKRHSSGVYSEQIRFPKEQFIKEI